MVSNRITSWEKLNFTSRDERRLRMSKQKSKRRKKTNSICRWLVTRLLSRVLLFFIAVRTYKLPAIIKSSLKYPCYRERKTVVKCQASRQLNGCHLTGNIGKKIIRRRSSWENWVEERRCKRNKNVKSRSRLHGYGYPVRQWNVRALCSKGH